MKNLAGVLEVCKPPEIMSSVLCICIYFYDKRDYSFHSQKGLPQMNETH